jgi:hypothetical protein
VNNGPLRTWSRRRPVVGSLPFKASPGFGKSTRNDRRTLGEGSTGGGEEGPREAAISNTEKLAIEVIADRIQHGELPPSALNVSFTVQSDPVAVD